MRDLIIEDFIQSCNIHSQYSIEDIKHIFKILDSFDDVIKAIDLSTQYNWSLLDTVKILKTLERP